MMRGPPGRITVGLLGLAMLGAGCAPVYLSRQPMGSEPLIRVALQRSQPRAVIYGSYRVTAEGEGPLSAIAPGEIWTITRSGGQLNVEAGGGAPLALGGARLRLQSDGEFFVNEKMIRGTIEIMPEAGPGLLVVAEMPLEDYLPGVLAAEIGGLADRAPEAAKAQAVVSRSYAFTKLGSNGPFHIEAGVSHQCFDLDRTASLVVRQAVRDTRGMVLFYRDKAVSPNFHSTCGGRTARPSETWNAKDEDFPYLGSVEDKWCGISPRYSWSDTVVAEKLADRLFPGKQEAIKDVKVLKVGTSGRVISLLVSAGAGDTVLTKAAVRNGLRDKPLLSAWFDMATERTASGGIQRIILSGKGYGHGVGLCQWGAVGMARAGKSYESILKHYYKGVEIERVY